MTVQSGLVTFHSYLAPLMVDIDSVCPHPDNYNNGDIDAIAESIEVNGMYRPIYVQRSTGYIVAGNHTWYACKQLDATQIPVGYLDGDDIATLRTMVADNRIAALARPDDMALLKILDRLNSEDTLHGTGYTQGERDALQALSEIPMDNLDDFAQWPSLCFQVPPHVKTAFMRMTDVAVGDRERFELVLKLAGWDGKKIIRGH